MRVRLLGRRTGDDNLATKAAETLAAEGIQADVLDLRSLWPWDKSAVLESANRTGRLLIAHESVQVGGFGAEVASEIAEAAFEYLDAPPLRIGGADLPIAFSKAIEDEVYSARARLGAAVDKLLAY